VPCSRVVTTSAGLPVYFSLPWNSLLTPNVLKTLSSPPVVPLGFYFFSPSIKKNRRGERERERERERATAGLTHKQGFAEANEGLARGSGGRFEAGVARGGTPPRTHPPRTIGECLSGLFTDRLADWWRGGQRASLCCRMRLRRETARNTTTAAAAKRKVTKCVSVVCGRSRIPS